MVLVKASGVELGHELVGLVVCYLVSKTVLFIGIPAIWGKPMLANVFPL
ncbi:hypothetical protein GIHI108528_13360 [Gillisia hiemivivida]